MTEAMNESKSDADVFRILITNDNHVGFKEDDKIRKRDALATFEEILQIARSMKVDFVLHSGDLFDDARPNRFWMNSVMRLFREYCFGNGGVAFHQIKTEFSKPANFEDPNMNIDLPVFMIHGNHDDAGGEFGDSRALSCGDLLETANLVTYFGQHDNVEEEIKIAPILLRKGRTKLALYGLGNIRDDRLHRMFAAKKVSFLAPPDEDFFNLMSIHQNRFRGNSGGAPSKSCIHPNFLPSFLNLVIWAHEHECIPFLEESVEAGFHILQSGSSVATSLTSGEKMQKHVFVVEISNIDGEVKFRSTPVPLLTVRSLLVQDFASAADPAAMAQVVSQMITEAPLIKARKDCLFTAIRPELPLIRLRLTSPVGDSGSHVMNQKFGRQFIDRVANPDELLQVVKSRIFSKRKNDSGGVVQLEIEDDVVETDVQDLIFNYMGGAAGEALLEALVEPDFNVAVQEFVHKSDAQAIDRFVKTQLDLIAKAALASGASDVLAVNEVVKQRALNARTECLNRAVACEAPKLVPNSKRVKSDFESDLFDDQNSPNPIVADANSLKVANPMVAAMMSHNPMVAAMSSQGSMASQWARRM